MAAATASLFAIRLEQLGQPAPLLESVTFGLILLLGVGYSLSVPAARWLQVARPARQGVALVGDRPFLHALGEELARQGVPTLVVGRTTAGSDRDFHPAYRRYGGPLRDLPRTGLLDDMAQAVVASGDGELNLVALTVLIETMGRRAVYLLPEAEQPGRKRTQEQVDSYSRRPFQSDISAAGLAAAVARGHRPWTMSAAHRWRSRRQAMPAVAPLVRISADGTPSLTPGRAPPGTGERLVVLDLAPSGPAVRCREK